MRSLGKTEIPMKKMLGALEELLDNLLGPLALYKVVAILCIGIIVILIFYLKFVR